MSSRFFLLSVMGLHRLWPSCFADAGFLVVQTSWSVSRRHSRILLREGGLVMPLPFFRFECAVLKERRKKWEQMVGHDGSRRSLSFAI